MAEALRGLGRPDEAESICLDVLEGGAQALASAPGLALRIHTVHALALLDQGREAEAEVAFREALESPRADLWEDLMSGIITPLVNLLRDQGRTGEASALLRDLIEERSSDPDFVRTCEALLDGIEE